MQQSLADLPTWLLILVALAGLTGEMWRADAAGMAVPVLIKRVLLRYFPGQCVFTATAANDQNIHFKNLG